MNRRRFERIVERALAEIPDEIAARLENVAVVIQDEATQEDLGDAGLPPGEELFGLYVGTPLTDRGEYHMVLPDRILIFQGPHERHFSESELRDEIRKTVIHEVGHYFGIEEERLHELGLQ